MIPRRHNHNQEEGTDSWLMSYADMITLLLCFFIIFVSVSDPKKDKFSAVTRGMADKFGMVDLSTPFHAITQGLQGVVERNKMFREIAVEASKDGIEMEISARKFFIDNTAELQPEHMAVLQEMAGALQNINFMQYRISIEGYTDNEAFRSPIYPSNWELSSARAARLARFFIENGLKAENFKVVGFGETSPKVPNMDGTGKPIPLNRERNQRVVIKLETLM